MHLKLSHGFAMLCLAILVGAFSVLSCGGGGGNGGGSALVAQESAETRGQIHVSAIEGSVPLMPFPFYQTEVLIRQIRFVPDSPHDIPLYVQVSGTFSVDVMHATLYLFRIRILDHLGQKVVDEYKLFDDLAKEIGPAQPYYMQVGMGHAKIGEAASFPASFYDIQLWVSGWEGQVDSSQFKVFVLGGSVYSPSGNIQG